MSNADNTNNTRNSFSTNTNNAIDAAQRENYVRMIESDRAEGQSAEQIANNFGIRPETVVDYFAAADALTVAILAADKQRFDQERHRRIE